MWLASLCHQSTRLHKEVLTLVSLVLLQPPDHDVNSRLWKMGRAQWDMYKSLLVVAGKSPIEITLDAKGSPAKIKKKGRGKAKKPVVSGVTDEELDAVVKVGGPFGRYCLRVAVPIGR